MRGLRFVNVAILSAAVRERGLVYAQEEKQDEKPARQEEPKPQPKQNEAKPASRTRPSQQKKRSKRNRTRKATRNKNGTMKPEQAEHARPAGKSGHIPDDKFRAHFGQHHTISRAKTVIVQGQPQFQYGGYTFQLVDAWPVGWAYTDDCYIDYVDGEYFLFDVLHPGVRVAVIVVM